MRVLVPLVYCILATPDGRLRTLGVGKVEMSCRDKVVPGSFFDTTLFQPVRGRISCAPHRVCSLDSVSDTTSSPRKMETRISIPFSGSLRGSPALTLRSSVLCHRCGSYIIPDLCGPRLRVFSHPRLLAPHSTASNACCLHSCRMGVSFSIKRRW